MGVSDIRYMTSDYRQRTVVVFVICYSLATIAVLLRFASRRIANNGFWWDDWIAIAALIFTAGFCASTVSCLPSDSILSGQIPMDATIAEHNIKGAYIAELFYYLIQITLKMSILMFYWRIFSSSNYFQMRTCIRFIGSFVVVWFIASFITAALQCIPVRAIWSPVAKSDSGTKCVNLNAFFFGTSIPNIVTDFCLVLLPVPQVLRLKIKNTQKVLVICLFLLGGFVVITSIVRLRLLLLVDFVSFPYNWPMEDSVVWTVVENCCGVTSICLPSLGPIFKIVPLVRRVFFRSSSTVRDTHTETYTPHCIRNNAAHQDSWSEITSTHCATSELFKMQKETSIDDVRIKMHSIRNSSQEQLAGYAA